VLVHEFFNIFPNHKGEVTVFETDPEKLIALSKAINNRQNVSIKACNYLESNVKGDIVIMNPPFTAPNSKVRIWKKFLNKASDSLVYAIVPHSGNNFNYEHEILISAFKFETCSFHGDLIKVQPHPPKLVKEKAECRYDVKLKGYYNATPDSDYIAFQINHYGEPGLNNPLDKGRAYIVVTGNDVHLIAQKLKNASWETAMRNNRVKHSGGLCNMNHSDVIRWINEL
jgi:hypothetical protein